MTAKLALTGKPLKRVGLPTGTKVVGCEWDATRKAVLLHVEGKAVPAGAEEVRIVERKVRRREMVSWTMYEDAFEAADA